MITLLLLVRDTYISVLFFAHIPFVVNYTFNATPTERLQQYKTPVKNLSKFFSVRAMASSASFWLRYCPVVVHIQN